MADSHARLDYDRLAANYARHRQIHPGVFADLIERSQISGGSRILEVGAGTGNYITALAKHVGCRCDAIEPSVEMLSIARQRTEKVAFRQGRAESLPFDDDSFDLIFSVDVIHHVIDRATFFAEALRVLKLGGKLCIATDSPEDIARRRPLSSHFPETVAKELDRYPSIATLHAEMSEAGFGAIEDTSVEMTYELTDIDPYRNRAYSSLHLIDDDAFARGIDRLESDLSRAPIEALTLYTQVWGVKIQQAD